MKDKQAGMTDLDYLKSFVTTFINKQHREYFLDGIEKMSFGKRSYIKNEDDLINWVIQRNDISMFEPSYATELPGKKSAQGLISLVQETIKDYGLSTCHVLSESKRVNKQVLPIMPVLQEFVGQGVAVLITFIPGKLVYYESQAEFDSRGIILHKKQ